jgi:hypothetical protein
MTVPPGTGNVGAVDPSNACHIDVLVESKENLFVEGIVSGEDEKTLRWE